ncbi:autotransporter domain-containing protein [Pseudoalteromonas spongiae]|uniref:Autotransporter domain-containing protein n=1 Tax=Pseudoalteromonas spongiae TaxID=298657 RepID=A0ABU8EX16_9GAMM
MYNLNRFTYHCFLPVLMLGITTGANAVEVKVGQSHSDLPLDQSGTLTSVTPSGTSFSLAHDFSESVRVSLDYINWENTHFSRKANSLKIDSQSYAATLTYFIENFAISGNYTYWQSDYRESFLELPSSQHKTYAPSYGLSVGYAIFFDEWVIEPSLLVQYNEWRYRDIMIEQNEMALTLLDALEDETVVLSGLLSASKIIEIRPDTYLLAGGVIRWNELFQGDGAKQTDKFVSFAGRKSYPHNTDDDYAELSVFITYDITPEWMVELDSSIAFLPHDNVSSVSWRIGYRF